MPSLATFQAPTSVYRKTGGSLRGRLLGQIFGLFIAVGSTGCDGENPLEIADESGIGGETQAGDPMLPIPGTPGHTRFSPSQCDAVLDQQGATYPGQWSDTPIETRARDQAIAAFEQHYAESIDSYRLETQPHTTAVELNYHAYPFGDGIPASNEADDEDGAMAASEFLQRWSTLFNPYGVILEQPEPPERSGFIYNYYNQDYCGLGVRVANNSPRSGQFQVALDVFDLNFEPRSPPFIFSIESQSVPLVPLPPVQVPPESIPSMFQDQRLGPTCEGESIVATNPCMVSVSKETVFVTIVEDTIHYRLAYFATIRPHGCVEAEGNHHWSYTIDAVDGQVLQSKSSELCRSHQR